MTYIEAIAVGFGICCVYLVVRKSIWCWPVGLVQVALYAYIFFDAKLYSDFLLHLFYVGLQFYGWHHWMRGGMNHGKAPITRLAAREVVAWALVSLVGAAVLGWTMQRFTDASVPYPDAFTTATSLVAQWLLARKKFENWYFWIAVDAVAIGVYFFKDLYLTAGLYAVFLALCIVGLRAWSEDARRLDTERLSSADASSPIPSSELL